jgi:hypothetical protein
MESKNVSVGAMLGLLALIAMMLYGWIMNIVKMFGMMGGDIDAELVIRLIGIPVAILGAVAGYL